MPTVKTYITLLLASACFITQAQKILAYRKGHTYYISSTGDDNADGNKTSPWQSIAKLNTATLQANDTVYFEGGQTFSGTVTIQNLFAGKYMPVVITSYGKGRATINGGDSNAITIYNSSHVKLVNINCIGNGRKDGNTKDGIAVNTCTNITIEKVDVSGFQKAGLFIYASGFVEVSDVVAHDNGFAGISISGDYGKHNCYNIHINNCRAENNPGDPNNLTNHSGNGIIAGYCKNVMIENSAATNNGWDMPRIGNGPVGIWCYEADSVTIQHCLSYKNKTSQGGGDGGGLDLDGGVTNSVIQYCLSYQNQGSGFGIFQYAGAGNWHDNVIRFNISEDDGNVSPAHAGIFIWNSSRDSAQFNNCLFYNNIIYNSKDAAISYDKESEHAGFVYYNNIFVAGGSLTTGNMGSDRFIGNNWYSLQGGFNMQGITNFAAWVKQNGHEQLNGKVVGLNKKPAFKKPGAAAITTPAQLKAFNNYQLPVGDVLRSAGVQLQRIGIHNGGKTFNLNPAPAMGLGASF